MAGLGLPINHWSRIVARFLKCMIDNKLHMVES